MPFEDAHEEAANLAKRTLSSGDPVLIADRAGGSLNETGDGKGILK